MSGKDVRPVDLKDLDFSRGRTPTGTHPSGSGLASIPTDPSKLPELPDETGCIRSQRRSFCKSTVAAGLTAVALTPPVAAGIRSVISVTEKEGLKGAFFPVTTLDSLDATPRKFYITAEGVQDGWITAPQKKIGSVFLYKTGENEVKAFHSDCPHKACALEAGVRKNPKTEQEEMIFYCPCHGAHFDLLGGRLDAVSISSRDLDSLEVKIEDGKVFIQFMNFISGIAEKKPA